MKKVILFLAMLVFLLANLCSAEESNTVAKVSVDMPAITQAIHRMTFSRLSLEE